MPAPCYYHPDAPSTGTCVQCGMPICALDTEIVAGKMVCKNCVAVVRARVEREMASQPAAAPNQSANQWNAPTASGPSYSGGGGGTYAPANALDPGKLAMGIAVSLVIGLVSAIAIEKILVASGFGLSYLYILMGYAIGYGLHKLTGEGGARMAGIALGVMVVSLVISHLVLVQDVLNKGFADGNIDRSVTYTQALPMVLGHLNFMHWVLIAIGLYSCFKGMMRRQ